MGDAEARSRALSEIREAFLSRGDATLLAGLYAARSNATAEYDRAEWRALIHPHLASKDPILRRAAMEALLVVKTDRADLEYWIEATLTADRQNAERTAEALVLLADGRVEGAVAEAILHLLRSGTDIKPAFVIRGLSDATVLEPRVEARLIEIVRQAEPGDYDSHYFFHFVARSLAPKSDVVVDLILDRAGTGRGQVDTILAGLAKGLDEGQRARAAERVMGFAENAGADGARRAVLKSLQAIAGPAQVARLEAMAADAELSTAVRNLAHTAAVTAARR